MRRNLPTPQLSSSKKLLFSLATLIAALLIAGIGGEIALRARHDSIEKITGVAAWRLDRWMDLTYHWDQYHPRLGWTNLPGYRSDAAVPFRVTINQQGLRASREFAPESPPGALRIALFGDSATFGEEVDDDATLPHHLERFLDGAEVLNFGVRGYGLGQMVLRLEEDGLALRPQHVVVVVLLPSDIARDALTDFSHPKPAFRVDGERLVIDNVPVPEASRQPWVMRRSFLAAWLWGRPSGDVPAAADDIDAQLQTTHALVTRARELCARQGATLTVVRILTAGTIQRVQGAQRTQGGPGLVRALGRMDATLEAAAPGGFNAMPFLERALNAHGPAIVAPRGHWSDEGNCLLAKQVAGHLAATLPAVRLAPSPPACFAKAG
jgi:hypothetical protein